MAAALVLRATAEYQGEPGALGWALALPADWSLVAINGPQAPAIAPAVGSTGTLEFAYTDVPAKRAEFAVIVRYPAIRMGDFKLVRYDNNADTLTGGRNQGVTAKKLYNLSEDIGETRDLAAALPEKLKELEAKWAAWNVSNVAPRWGSGGGSDGPEPGAATDKRGKRAGRKNAAAK